MLHWGGWVKPVLEGTWIEHINAVSEPTPRSWYRKIWVYPETAAAIVCCVMLPFYWAEMSGLCELEQWQMATERVGELGRASSLRGMVICVSCPERLPPSPGYLRHHLHFSIEFSQLARARVRVYESVYLTRWSLDIIGLSPWIKCVFGVKWIPEAMICHPVIDECLPTPQVKKNIHTLPINSQACRSDELPKTSRMRMRAIDPSWVLSQLCIHRCKFGRGMRL